MRKCLPVTILHSNWEFSEVRAIIEKMVVHLKIKLGILGKILNHFLAESEI